jgi:hypothetical protein
MPTYNEALTLYQSGREATKGTLVTATSKLAVEKLSIKPIDTPYRPKLAKGLVTANRGNLLAATQRGIEWDIPDTSLIFDQLQIFLAMALKGGVAPGSGPPYTWTYTRDPTINPTLDSRTFFVRLTDGGTPSDWKFGYAMLQELSVKGAPNEALKMSAKGFGRRLQTATWAAQAFPTIVQAPMPLTTVYIDTTWGGLGGSVIAGQVIGFTWNFMSGARPLWLADGQADLDFSIDVTNAENVKATLSLVILATASGQWATEKTAAEAGTLRAVEVRSTVSANATLKLQGLYKHTPASVFPDEDQEGQRVVTLELESDTDDTNFAQAVLINTTAAMV